MAAINDLLRQIPDAALRERLEQEFARLSKTKKFGLVFEEHLPECTPLYDVAVQRGSKAARRAGKIDDLYTVLEINGETALCLHKATSERQNIPVNDLIAVAQFGDPIFPSLIPISQVENASDDNLWHALIEADNYHALQLLEYLYPKQVDCIYIDPPYNTGARDWKYNNNYVDAKDNWRHSKWLAFMKRRLQFARHLLNPSDSMLILAIDDNELFNIGLLLDEIFVGCERQIIDITINPKGKARDGRLSQVDEFLIVVYIGEAAAQELADETSVQELRWPYLRRSDVESARGTTKGGVRQFYPIYVDEDSGKIVHVGEPLTPDQPLDSVPKLEGAVPVFPMREDGKHMNWGLTGPSLQSLVGDGYVRISKSTNPHQPYNFSYVTLPSAKKVSEGVYRVDGLRPDGSKIVVVPGGKPKRATTVWSKNLYDANAYGSQLLGSIIPDKKFPFPKSVYAVCDTLRTFVGNKLNAVILDFFAGSGTTLHAVNLLNVEDNGQRRCILVTNNEVSEDEATQIRAQGFQPGDPEWEMHGICQSVTWPRTAYSILGRRIDGSELVGEYYTNQVLEREVERAFVHLGFVDVAAQLTTSKKKQIVALMGKSKLPQSLVMAGSDFIVSDKHAASILFDSAHVEEYLDALSDQDHITEFYIVTKEAATFNAVKDKIKEMLGPVRESINLKRPMRAGFPANVEYFKLGFLDKYRVTLGQQFREILPLLWLKSGAVGKRPELTGQDIPDMLVLPQNNFAILIDETRYAAFIGALAAVEDINTIYFVTNSEEAFREMSAGVKALHTYQLYRDYIDNFVLGTRRDSL